MLSDRPILGRRTGVFTLQWSLTNACEGRCAHCYDRSDLRALPTADCMEILRGFREFCRAHRVRGHITLTGGNPLLHPGFWEIYAAIAQSGTPLSILGNPIDEPTLARLVEIARPSCYQVSLEGMQPFNDAVRGDGHFNRVLTFLNAAARLRVNTHVMLTLQKANMDQVIPLGLSLAPITGRFTFNRLAQVGEARDIELPDRDSYEEFLHEYLDTAAAHPVLGLKENLLNIIRHSNSAPMLGGCTGQGCGAAFNFVAVLPDGETHACRKFPSPIGRLPADSLTAIYNSPAARQYRRGPLACRRCPINHRCRGCMAVIHGHGQDPLTGPDPHCFMKR